MPLKVEIADMTLEARYLVSLAAAIELALSYGHTSCDAYAGAAYILRERLQDFTKRLEELSEGGADE